MHLSLSSLNCLFFRTAPILALLGLSVTAKAEVRLPKILSSHAVLQRDQPLHIWGFSDPNEKVSASIAGVTQSTIADASGDWSVYLPPMHAGGPFELTVAGTNKIVLDDILIGDVWFASGQSNMEMPLNGFPGSAVVKNAAEEIKNANQPNLRLLFIPHAATTYPLNDIQGDAAWSVCSPETAAKFSAVAYFFGRDIAAQEHIPIGLIDSTWGGTPAETWVSLDGLSANSSLMAVFASWARLADAQADVPALRRAEKREDEAARQTHSPLPKHPWHPDPASWDPSWLFNGMIAPAINYGIRGVIWYQGETNSKLDRAPLYHQVFSTLIEDWRRHWGEGDFPFLFTQISSFKSDETEDWPTVRDGQRRTLSVANTAMAVTIDVGDPNNVHPSDKQTVGARLALAARAMAYHEDVEYSGPLFRQTSTEEGAIRVWFTHANGGLTAKDGALEGFEVAGDEHKFLPAAARIDGSSVVLTNSDIKNPRYVRYGWQNAPVLNLYNSAGLPASPFTSEPRF
ncbi:MAG TPA: sialate O-acetylesterase [Bryobacteraceae bacterium]|nr:sialate O-acetylesterase [Bryobacteraceae bacterium]